MMFNQFRFLHSNYICFGTIVYLIFKLVVTIDVPKAKEFSYIIFLAIHLPPGPIQPIIFHNLPCLLTIIPDANTSLN